MGSRNPSLVTIPAEVWWLLLPTSSGRVAYDTEYAWWDRDTICHRHQTAAITLVDTMCLRSIGCARVSCFSLLAGIGLHHPA